MRLSLVACCQLILYLLLKVPVTILFRVQCRGNAQLGPGTIIIASNHPSALDPLLVCFSLPPAIAFRLIPVRFVTAACYMQAWHHRLILSMLGCVSTEPSKDKVLKRLAKAAERGDSVYFFPSGQRDAKTLGRPKIGFVYLERMFRNARILPIHIGLTSVVTLQNLIKRRISARITVLPPYRHKDFPQNLQPLADDVMGRIARAAT